MQKLSPQCVDFHEIRYLNNFFRKSVQIIKVSLTYARNKRHFTWRRAYFYDNIRLNFSGNDVCTFMTILGWIFLGMTYVFLWQYQAEFFWEWRKYFYDNIRLNFPGNDVCIFMTISGWIFLGMRNISDQRCRENQNTYFMINNLGNLQNNNRRNSSVLQVRISM